MSGGNDPDGGQAEAVAAIAAGAARAEPLEGLEQAVDLGSSGRGACLPVADTRGAVSLAR